MSNLRTPNGDDFPDAARRHCEDARRLVDAGRADNAAYLAGYVVECCEKTMIQVEQGSPWGHDLEQLSRRAADLARLPGARTARYSRTTGSAKRGSIYDYSGAGWQEGMRYGPTGAVSLSQACGWVEEAERTLDETVNAMVLDGVIH